MTIMANKEQIKQSMAQLIDFLADNEIARRDKEIFTVSGQWTVPSGVTRVYVSGCAGGGGGSSHFPCGGGGGESCFRTPVDVTPGQVISYVIGTGGAGNKRTADRTEILSGSYSGGNGTNTSFGSFLTLQGGKGAMIIQGSPVIWNPGEKGGFGATSGQYLVLSVYNASADNSSVEKGWTGGKGGDSMFGTGGTGGLVAEGVANAKREGDNGVGFGSGGGGGYSNWMNGKFSFHGGGNGANGILIVEW